MNENRANALSALTYTGIATVAASAFLAVTLFTGDYNWAARFGGAGWVFLLSMIILMPTVTPWIKRRLEQPRDGHQNSQPEEATMSSHDSSSSAKSAAAKDPICGMSVAPATARWVSDYQGTKYHFCSKGCKDTFDKNPVGYIK
jgi:YHS domain-containing protein